ncbi:hypothetical protein M378DRAFT_16618 [Amanita muscaria Koide BX008]|uniref:Uncharacterized protein n=1 Tax=Amanita muscaria (strain Koide BX008) TaxID=946122 RepID=A0A0C2SSG3_AMAMK|nr:hypothetical protein M378DRAFT_16618 [Amanita muscaria Koide BX008]
MVLDEIQDTLGGSLNIPSYPSPPSLPPIRPPQVQQPQGGEQLPSSSARVAATRNSLPPDGGPGHPGRCFARHVRGQMGIKIIQLNL